MKCLMFSLIFVRSVGQYKMKQVKYAIEPHDAVKKSWVYLTHF